MGGLRLAFWQRLAYCLTAGLLPNGWLTGYDLLAGAGYWLVGTGYWLVGTAKAGGLNLANALLVFEYRFIGMVSTTSLREEDRIFIQIFLHWRLTNY